MKIINITQNKFDNLKSIGESISLESEIYVLDDNTLLKRLYGDLEEEFKNKLYTIEELDKLKKYIDIPELIFPDTLVKTNDTIIGFTMPYINGETLDEILKSDKYPEEEKINYLKQVGIILEKMEYIRNNSKFNNFYLNDIHAGNFMLDKTTNQIKVIDLDSSKIGNNEVKCSKYLNPFGAASYVPKYLDENNKFKISYNTELYCYIMMVLNYISDNKVSNLNVQDYYRYLEYLKDQRISNKLLERLSYVYMNIDNENIYREIKELLVIKEPEYNYNKTL